MKLNRKGVYSLTTQMKQIRNRCVLIEFVIKNCLFQTYKARPILSLTINYKYYR